MRRALGWLFLLPFVMWVGCTPPTLDCTQNADCSDGKECINGQCKAGSGGCKAGEQRGCYTGAPDTRLKGNCRDGVQTCQANGTWPATCDNEVLPTTEVCDGKDNNCNGKVDDVQATAEVCDGIDNDCDGKVDNIKNTDKPLTQECYTGPANTAGKGPCKRGNHTCTNGKWPASCPGEVLPQTELCNNGIDEDCDGKTDNIGIGEACTDPNKTGECQAGTWQCDANGKKTCKSNAKGSPESCNNKDDDCDGKTDNQAGSDTPLQKPCPYTGPAGTENKGPCKAGQSQCTNGTWSTTCTGQVVPTTETCNNQDDDCNGQIDDNIKAEACYVGPTGTENVGPCKGGTRSCSGGKWSSCKGQVVPQDELCNNGIDEDCNGKVDDVAHLGAFCLDSARKGTCKQGVYTCKGNKRICEQVTQPGTETCDGNDNDCDGQIDNQKGKTTPLQRACYTGTTATRKKGTCKDGKQSCIQGRWSQQCQGEVVPTFELCNKKDDDCNGQIDDKNACAACTNGSTRPCFSGPQTRRGRGGCQDGKETCVNKKWSGTCTGDTTPATETCNNKDDDCDGLVDNQPNSQSPLRQACYTGAAATRNKGTCLEGFQACTNGQWGTCTGEFLPSNEICDGLDNNCDGQTDEGQVCQANPKRKLFETCDSSPSAPASLTCDTGLMCIAARENDPKAFCYQLCTTAQDCAANTDGRTDCALLEGTTSICVSRAAEGAACQLEQGKLCQAGLFCDDNIRRCRKQSEAPTHGRCGGQSGLICDANHLCVPLTPGVQGGHCLKQCKTNGDCASGICLFFSATSSACAPLGTRKEDQVCGRGDLGNQLDTSRYCAKGLFCSRFSPINPDGVCLKLVANCTSCNSGRLCVPLGNGRLPVCAKSCGTCPTGQQCTRLTQTQTACTPVQPNGPVPFAGRCGPQRLCNQGLFCLSSDPTRYDGFCSKINCTKDSDCPTIPPGAKCRSLTPGSNAKACLFPCTSNQNCPTGLACATNLQACVAP